MPIPLQKTSNIGEILLTFTAAERLIGHSPDFSLKHVLDTRNRKSYTKDISQRGMLGKTEVARIGLNLNPQVRFSLGEIDVIRKSFDGKNLSTQRFDSVYVFSRDHDIQNPG
ncbi:MAG: hypothetical protein EXQ58_13220 [Acidobacteria bacterium]|nr:hypothetical protein [Acidobacteriota bacterium]